MDYVNYSCGNKYFRVGKSYSPCVSSRTTSQNNGNNQTNFPTTVFITLLSYTASPVRKAENADMFVSY